MIGQIISHYKILEKLGEGGMGVVYKAQDLTLDRPVALKFLPPRLGASDEEKLRLIQEARAASALNHPNVATIHEIGDEGGRTFLVMEYVDGVTLREKLQSGPPKIKEAVGVALQTAEALQKAHENQIVHRDIKSDNIMITKDGLVKVMDFGLAKLKGAAKLTKSGSTVGTAAYMAPEQIQGEETDHRADIFSYGVVLYEMFSGRLPFRGEHEAALMYEIVNVEPPFLSIVRSEVDAELNRIVMKSLEKDRDERYQSMREVVVDLKRYKRDSEGKRLEYPPTMTVGKQVRKRQGRPRSLVIPVLIIAVLVLAATAIYLFSPPSEKRISIAVLPFVNVSENPDAEYLSDGITESIISSLSRLPDLRVMARSSVFHFKATGMDPLQVGKELGVDVVLTGRVLQRGDTLIIRSELVNVEDGSQLWGAQYAQKLLNVLAMQEEIAKQISTRLVPRLTSDEEKLVTKRYTESAEAYRSYLKGRYHWNKRTEEGFKAALKYFNDAIEADPTYAFAYTGIADTYILMANYSLLPPNIALEKGKTAAFKAIELDEKLAESHISLGAIYEAEWKWADAEREYRRGVDLNSNYATGRQWLGELLVAMGRIEEGMEQIELARSVDPLSLIINTSHAIGLYFMGRYTESIEDFRKTLELDSTFLPALAWSAYPHVETREWQKPIELTKRAIALSNDLPDFSLQLAYIYARSGRKDEAIEILRNVEVRYKDTYVSSFSMAIAYAGLRDKDRTFLWLERAVQEHSVTLPQLRYDPLFQEIRSDQRYANIMKRMGLDK